jgi:hypothetical protein
MTGLESPASSRSLREVLKAIGSIAYGLIISIGVILITVMFVRGAVWLSEKIFPVLISSTIMTLMFCIGLLPLTAFRETRGPAGVAFFIASYVFGATLWFGSILLTYNLWGLFALLIGLFLAGFGVFPIALLATAFKGEWTTFAQLIVLGVAIVATRFTGVYLVARGEQYRDERPEEYNNPASSRGLIIASWLLFAASFVSYIGYVTLAPLIACAAILCFSKSPRARRHGRIILLLCFLIGVAVVVIGYYFFA